MSSTNKKHKMFTKISLLTQCQQIAIIFTLTQCQNKKESGT